MLARISWLLLAVTCLVSAGLLADDEAPAQPSLNEQALELLDQQKFDEAIRLLEKATRESDNEVVHRNLAVAYNNRGLYRIRELEFGPAVLDFEAAIRKESDEPLFRVHLGWAHLKRRDYMRARSVLEATRRAYPDEPRTYDYLGFLHYSLDELEPAVELLEQRLELKPDSWASGLLAKARRELEVSSSFVDRSSNDFTLKFLGSDKNYKVADAILRILEESRATVSSDLGHFPTDRTTVLLYGRKEFEKATGAHSWVGGLYDGKIRLPLDDFDRQKESLARTIRHEYTHRVLAEMAPGLPVWLNEGIAEWFEDGGTQPHDRIKGLLPEDGAAPKFTEMPKTFVDENDVGLVRMRYAASRSFVAFLRDRYGLGALRQFVVAVGKGATVDEAMKRTYGRTLEELEVLWSREVLS